MLAKEHITGKPVYLKGFLSDALINLYNFTCITFK
jgi:hypothetical protein